MAKYKKFYNQVSKINLLERYIYRDRSEGLFRLTLKGADEWDDHWASETLFILGD